MKTKLQLITFPTKKVKVKCDIHGVQKVVSINGGVACEKCVAGKITMKPIYRGKAKSPKALLEKAILRPTKPSVKNYNCHCHIDGLVQGWTHCKHCGGVKPSAGKAKNRRGTLIRKVNSYSYTYHALHVLRRWALNKVAKKPYKLMCRDYDKPVPCALCAYCQLTQAETTKEQEKLVKFYEFINHSDCDDGYLSFSSFDIPSTKTLDNGWGNLDRLKEEVAELDKHRKTLPKGYENVWRDFKNDVDRSVDRLEFR